MLSPKPIACLAPMDGITDSAYRRIVRKLNPEVVLFSEFTSINGIEHSEVVRSRLDFNEAELPYVIQLFGNEPELFARTVVSLQDSGISGIDINMGCPSKNIIKSESGGSLMKNKDLACRIVEACVQASKIPISVKTRLGWADSGDLIEFGKALEDAGASMISVHGRTYQQKYKGTADWKPIYHLKQSLKIPVVGNGDLCGNDHAQQKLGDLDGYMIGRASIGNPWVFWSDKKRQQLHLNDKIEIMMLHFSLLRQSKKEQKALIEFRKHISGYIAGFRGAKTMRLQLMKSQNEREFFQTAESIMKNRIEVEPLTQPYSEPYDRI